MFMQREFKIADPIIRSSWFALGRPGNIACIVVEAPPGWKDSRYTLRLFYRLDTHEGMLEPDPTMRVADPTALERETDSWMFGQNWQQTCTDYAPIERRVTKIFGW